jgi:hypothetical protein
VDGLRAISRDFDLQWQPGINEDLAAASRDWRNGLRSGQHIGRQAFGAFLALLPFGALAWQR